MKSIEVNKQELLKQRVEEIEKGEYFKYSIYVPKIPQEVYDSIEQELKEKHDGQAINMREFVMKVKEYISCSNNAKYSPIMYIHKNNTSLMDQYIGIQIIREKIEEDEKETLFKMIECDEEEDEEL